MLFYLAVYFCSLPVRLDLVREPGALDLASKLSCPHTYEVVNCAIETLIYSNTQVVNTQFGVEFDFRKRLYVSTICSGNYIRGLD